MKVTGRTIMRGIVERMAQDIGNLSDRDLSLFIKTVRSLNQTNCWWFEYALKDAMKDMAIVWRKDRARLKRLARSTNPVGREEK